MDISVVTPVRDDPLIGQAITSVPAGIDHVVAFTQPSDRVRTIVEAHREKSGLRLVETSAVGMAPGVNRGVEAARHEKVVLLDSDCTLEPGTLEAYARALDASAFVRGRTIVRQGPGWARFSGLGQAELNRTFARGRARLIGPSIAFRRTAFLELGGYDPHSGASCDHEFVLRMEDRGITTAFEADAVIFHQALTFRIDVRAHLGYGRSMAYIDQRRGGRYGLGICTLRLYPSTLANKLVYRGLESVFRSLLLGTVMLYGYADQFWRRPLGPS
jgi:GT2 family glycosyltransferase